MAEQYFADIISGIAVTGNLVRLDFATLASEQPADAKESRRFVNTHRVVIPLDGFLRGLGAQQGVVQKLVEAGVLKAQPAPDGKPLAS